MARPRTEGIWVETIRMLTEKDRRLGPLGIRSRLKEVVAGVENAGGVKVPSLRTIGRIQKQYKGLPPAERLKYRLFYWPESMQSGVLPWEASTDALTLLRYYHHDRRVGRPLLVVVKWFWWVSQAVPDSSVEMRESLARQLGASEIAGSLQEVSREVEWFLAYAPWRSDEDARAYEDAKRYEATSPPQVDLWSRELIPPHPAPPYTDSVLLRLPAGTDLENVLDAFDAMQGVAMSEASRSATRDILLSKHKWTDTPENGGW